MPTQVRLTITISESDMVKLRIAAARQHMAASSLARVWVSARLAKMHVVEPPVIVETPLFAGDPNDEVPF